jgi:EAL domain-containing protein (putative c-di-GMP-specific phosphodiesterase class I)/GGDEF domain-containing protein
MTLLLLLFVLCLGMLIISIQNSRNFFVQQLNSNAQDTATSLGLSLSQALAGKDKALMLSMVQAVFDRGYFYSVKVKDMDDNILVSREVRSHVRIGPPQWFRVLLPVESISQKAIVMHGWLQVGRVEVVSDPSWAYLSMWKNAKALLYWYILLSFIAMLVTFFWVQSLLRPLKAIRQQADDICNRSFSIQKQSSKTAEFRSVTTAMNRMVGVIQDIYETQLAQIKRLRKQTYVDEVTGLSNRRLFIQQLSSTLLQEDEFVPGYLIVLVLHGLDSINKQLSAELGDSLLQDIGGILEEISQLYRFTEVYRIRGSQFAVVTQRVSEKQVQQLLANLNAELSNLSHQQPLATFFAAALDYHQYENIDGLLHRADQALHDARNSTDHIHISTKTSASTLLITKDLLENALVNKSIKLYTQAVHSDALSQHKVFHQEIFIRLERGSEVIRAGYFMHIAESEKCASKIDVYVIQTISESEALSQQKIAINVSHQTILDPRAQSYFVMHLKAVPTKYRKNLSIEINEIDIHEHFDAAETFIQEVNRLGCSIGVDHIGAHFNIMQYLKNLPVEYIKIDGTLLQDILNNDYKQFYIQYFHDISQTMDIKLIATQIENDLQMKILAKLDIHYFQGKYISLPQRLD